MFYEKKRSENRKYEYKSVESAFKRHLLES